MKYLVWGMLLGLVVLHQDFWFWNDGRLIFGLMPVGLLYHAGHSLACVVVWFLVTRYAWPTNLDLGGDPGERTDA